MGLLLPGTTIEVGSYANQTADYVLSNIFAAGGIVLSQMSTLTGLEAYTIQNWVKRGFLSSPQKRMYSKEQFARIIIINMLREALQIEKICELMKIIGGVLDDPEDDMISDDELYHRYVDMIADDTLSISDMQSIENAAKQASEDFRERFPHSKDKLVKILEVMLYAHSAATLRKRAEETFSTLQ